MKAKELKQKTVDELKKMLIQEQEKYHNLRFDLELKKIKNVRELRKTKKIIAQIITIIKEKEYGQK